MNREFICEDIVFLKEVRKKFAKKELRLKIQQIRPFLLDSSKRYFWTDVRWKQKENSRNAEMKGTNVVSYISKMKTTSIRMKKKTPNPST